MSFFATILVGILAGWFAEKAMKVDMPLWKNLVVGLLGGALGSAVLGIIGYETTGGIIAGVLVAFVGACIILWAWKKITGKKA